MKKRIFVILAAAALITQAAYGMKKKKIKDPVVAIIREEEVVKTKKSPLAKVTIKHTHDEFGFQCDYCDGQIDCNNDTLRRLTVLGEIENLLQKTRDGEKNIINEHYPPKHQYVIVVTEEPIIIEMEKPAWLNKIVFEPKLSKVTLYCCFANCAPFNLTVSEESKKLEKLVKNIQNKGQFTKMHIENESGQYNSRGDCEIGLKSIVNAIIIADNLSSKNLHDISYLDQWGLREFSLNKI